MSAKNDRAVRRAHATNVPAAAAAVTARPAMNWRPHALVALGLCLVLLAAYSNSFRSGFVFDNKPIILDDPRVHAATPANLAEIWNKGYWFAAQDPTLYRPLVTFSYLFNYAILGNGVSPAGYHWINFTLHLINALLVYALGLVLFRKIAPAASLATLWALHPALTESVTNIVGRADLLACFGVLAGLLCHVKAVKARGARRFLWLFALAGAGAVGIFSKESAVVLIALMLVYDLAFRRTAMMDGLSGYAFAAMPMAVFFYLRSQALASLPASPISFVNNPLIGAGFLASRLTAIQVIGRYMLLLLWPASLSSDYSYNQIPIFHGTFHNPADWASIGALAVCLAAAALAAVWYRSKPAGFFFAALFFLALAPVANIALLIATIMAERFLYLPSIGFIGCLVWAAYAASDRVRARSPRAAIALPVILALVCAALLIRTHLRNDDWETERTLWASAVIAAPNSYKTHQNLAVEYFRNPAEMDRTLAEDNRALAILNGLSPQQEDVMPFVDAGAHYRTQGDLLRKSGAADAAAQSVYHRALEILEQGVEVDRARKEAIDRANRMAGKPAGRWGTVRLYQELGQAYLRTDRPRQALEAFNYGLLLEPSHELLQLVSEAQTALHNPDGAAIALMEGVVMYPGEKGFPSELLKLYQGINPPGCAIENAASGASLNLGCPLVRNHLCAATARLRELYAQRGDSAKAEEMRMTAAPQLGCPAQ